MKNRRVMMINSLKSSYLRISLLLLSVFFSFAAAEDWKSVLDLRGKWKFELGDDQKRAGVTFNDSKWDEIFVPSAWEDEGYPGYDGYAWYRKHFRLPQGAEKKTLSLRLGCIDDVSEIYLNGVLLGIMGCFPPNFESAYNVEIILGVPQNVLNVSGDNVIAVRVYDDQLSGGIVQGKVGLYEAKDYLAPEISFVGKWRFKTGDSEKWSDPLFDDRSWNQIFVPACWETQGYHDYDGMGWYRLHFQIPAELEGKSLVILLGKIDDLDETYINGEEVGHVGKIRSNPNWSHYDNEYKELRAYTVRNGLLKAGTDNVIAVRVYDGGGWGGIYEGPVGIISRERYKEWRQSRPWKDKVKEESRNIFDLIFDN
jgi:sialate O-acetylesterase